MLSGGRFAVPALFVIIPALFIIIPALFIIILAMPFLAIFGFDRLRFMQAILTEHAFNEFGRSSSEDTNMLQGHNTTLALPSHRNQELLTAQALITALMLADKHCQAILHFARLTAAEKEPMPFWCPQTDHALSTSRSEYGINFQETEPRNSDLACNKRFSWLAPEEKVEAPGPDIASKVPANQKLHKVNQFDRNGFLRQSLNSDVEAIHQGAKSDAHVRDHSLAATRQDSVCGHQHVVHKTLDHLIERTVRYLDHCSSDGNNDLDEVLVCSTWDKSFDESAMGNGSTELWARRRRRLNHATNIRNMKSMNGDFEQVARNAMLSFGLPAVQVQWLCIAQALQPRGIGPCLEMCPEEHRFPGRNMGKLSFRDKCCDLLIAHTILHV
jgi:hypothetical protein